jgi:flagellin-like protein
MKGISAIIATVLLVAFTVAVAGILSMWATTLTVSQTQTVSNQTSGQALCSPGLIIDEVNSLSGVAYHNAGNQIISNVKVFVRNTVGGVNLTSVSGTLSPGAMALTNFTLVGPLDYARVTGTCASNVQLSAECKSPDPCWKG